MTCPFLKETQVRYCETAAVRKLIPLGQTGMVPEKCASPEHMSCAVYRKQPQDRIGEACPYLRESLMQYCGASPVPKFVPYSESLLSRCGSDGYRYCELYQGMAHPERGVDAVDGIPMPGWLRYAPNHMWLDLTNDGMCHAGIDAFLSRAVGKIDSLTFVCPKAQHQAGVVITAAGGLNLELVFPNRFLVTSCNLYLRANPTPLHAEPYTRGWLFEGVPEAGTTAHLLEGGAAREWMQEEQRRMNEFLQQVTAPTRFLAADGGVCAGDLAAQLDRDQMLTLFHEFFSPYASGKKEA